MPLGQPRLAWLPPSPPGISHTNVHQEQAHKNVCVELVWKPKTGSKLQVGINLQSALNTMLLESRAGLTRPLIFPTSVLHHNSAQTARLCDPSQAATHPQRPSFSKLSTSFRPTGAIRLLRGGRPRARGEGMGSPAGATRAEYRESEAVTSDAVKKPDRGANGDVTLPDVDYNKKVEGSASGSGPQNIANGRDTDDGETLEAWKNEIALASSLDTKKVECESEDVLQAQIDKRCADNIRMLVVDSVNNAKAGHPGLPMGLAEVGYVLWKDVMKYNPENPRWFNRDRFVLSAGHGCLLQYICLHLAGYDLQVEDLKRLCKMDGRTPGHPENVTTAGIEVTTGPLGQGVANAVGLAIAERHLAARFNKSDATVVDHRTYCIMGDGCAMEGIANEAASLAGHLKLHKLTVIYDDNHNTIDGDTSLAFDEDVAGRFRALGWHTITIDNIYEDLSSFRRAVLDEAVAETDKPTFIQVKSSIGRLSQKEGTAKAHHGTFDEEDVTRMKQKLRWPAERKPFYVLPMVYERFRENGRRGAHLEQIWKETVERYETHYPAEGGEFRLLLDRKLPSDWARVLPVRTLGSPGDEPVDATRSYSDKCLNALAKVIPGLIGGSADLASSNKVSFKDMDDFSPTSPWGRNIHYGVREHAMAGISNGLALHSSGLIPVAATFLIFSDYMKNAIRLSSLSEAQVLYILTHDSIGLGEDGPTHQPVEQLVGLRAIPNMVVLRPADGNETAGAYKVAIARRHGPTVISLSRQKVLANVAGSSVEGVEKGGYIVSDNSNGQAPDIILIGTGSELCLCEGAAENLRKEGTKVRVVSLVSWEIFDDQGQEYKESILPPKVHKRLAVEAGSPIGWREYVGPQGHVLGVRTFGASGAYLDVFKKYGFTVEHVEEKARLLLQQ